MLEKLNVEWFIRNNNNDNNDKSGNNDNQRKISYLCAFYISFIQGALAPLS
jgi:hypothetical protein